LRIGLLNNLPEAAMAAGERQFRELAEAARGKEALSWRLFALDEVPRSPAGTRALRPRHGSGEDLLTAEIDLLIVTGAEPRADHLHEEPYYRRLAEVVGWAAHNTVTTFWSCLSAHLAVEVLDAVPRRALARKRTGVFETEILADHALAPVGSDPRLSPHSRWNEVGEEDLQQRGYGLLTRSPEAGADLFVKETPSLFVFAQGHPEYGADTLLQELRRDLKRHARGEQSAFPSPPLHLLPPALEARLLQLEADASRGAGGDAAARALSWLSSAAPDLRKHLAEPPSWRGASVDLFAAWLRLAAERREAAQTSPPPLFQARSNTAARP
jgi:homoserine O-succinyltransferase